MVVYSLLAIVVQNVVTLISNEIIIFLWILKKIDSIISISSLKNTALVYAGEVIIDVAISSGYFTKYLILYTFKS